MKIIYKFIILGLLCGLSHTVLGQSYFQQKVDYEMVATLDTLNQTLSVKGKMHYHNNSKESLDHLLIHLWWNAFSDKQSAFANQQYKLRDYDFHFADAEDMGGYESLTFLAEEGSLPYVNYEDEKQVHQDIIRLELATAIAPGGQQIISFSYVLDIPPVFSRPGFDGELYRMTQWYPKPAVYDEEGWHPMPYLSMGEYFAEYGDYEVELNLPTDHAMASTGMRAEQTSLSNGHSIKAENVLDFAWFSSTHFDLHSKKVQLRGREVDLFLLTDNDVDVDQLMRYMSNALEFYSYEVGAYPYPQYSLVYDEGDERGGMEYPMISMVDHTGVGQNVDNLIAHEIGHNWFQSILGSNERKYPWMDEGLNSFYERAYNDKYYEEANFNVLPSFLQGQDNEFSTIRSGVYHFHCCRKLTCIDTPSDEMDLISYGSNSYERMAWYLEYLEAYLGEEAYREAMQGYYREWAHRHPSPKVLQAIFESVSGKNLNFFFDDLLKKDRRFDYEISNVETEGDVMKVEVNAKTEFQPPYSISAYDKEGKLVHDEWFEADRTTVSIPKSDYDRITINGKVSFADENRTDNHYYPSRWFPRTRPTKIGFLGNNADSKVNKLSLTPLVTYNKYDGLTIGAFVSTKFFPYRKWRGFIQPGYGLKSKELSGRFGVERDFFFGESPRITLGLSGRRYVFISSDGDLDYQFKAIQKLRPSLSLHFNTNATSSKSLTYAYHTIKWGISEFDVIKNKIHQLTYQSSSQTRLGKQSFMLQAEYESYLSFFEGNDSYLKISSAYNRQFNYNLSSKFFFRVFGGYFLQNSRRESSSFATLSTKGSISLTQQGYTDHTYEGLYVGRTEQEGWTSQQFSMEEGGFKLPITSSYSGVGNSNDWGVTVNLKADLPVSFLRKIGMRPWLDLGVMSTKQLTARPLENKFYMAGGLAIELGEYFGLYYPLYYSSEFEVPMAGKGFFQKLSFKMDIAKINPWRMSENVDFAF